MNERKQLITPLMTDEEAQRIAHRSMLAVEAVGFIMLMAVCVMAWFVVPA